MSRRIIAVAIAVSVAGSSFVLAQGRIKQHGRATVEFKSDDALAVVNYDYAQTNHDGPWLLLDFAIQTKPRIAIHRDQVSLRGADERVYRLASQKDFLDDQGALNRLKQNAITQRRDLRGYFTTSLDESISFFAWPKAIVQDTFTTNLDDPASGDLLFKTPDGKWAAGTYHLIINHEKAKVDLPIELR